MVIVAANVTSVSNITSSPAPPPQSPPLPPPPPSPDNATSPATIAYESVISLRQLNIAVVAVLILLVILVLILSFVKARATWQHQRAATQDPDPQALQPVGNRGLLMDGRNMRSGVPDHIIKTLGKSFTYVEPGDDLEAGGTSALDGDGGGGAGERGGGGVGEGGALGASGRSSSRRSAAAEATGGESEGNGAGGRAGREEGDDEKECIVCLGEYKTGDVIRQLHACNHQFHQDCIDAWLKTNSSCPLCRTSLIPSRLLGNNQGNLSDIPEQQGLHGSVLTQVGEAAPGASASYQDSRPSRTPVPLPASVATRALTKDRQTVSNSIAFASDGYSISNNNGINVSSGADDGSVSSGSSGSSSSSSVTGSYDYPSNSSSSQRNDQHKPRYYNPLNRLVPRSAHLPDECAFALPIPLHQCALGYSQAVRGGYGRAEYVVSSDDDSLTQGTLRWGLVRYRAVGVYVRFSRNMEIRLRGPLRLGSHVTLDGRGARVRVAGGAVVIRGSRSIIIHNLQRELLLLLFSSTISSPVWAASANRRIFLKLVFCGLFLCCQVKLSSAKLLSITRLALSPTCTIHPAALAPHNIPFAFLRTPLTPPPPPPLSFPLFSPIDTSFPTPPSPPYTPLSPFPALPSSPVAHNYQLLTFLGRCQHLRI
ncbi:unnamed protein product [Closterium sp. NIES-53]